MFDALFGGTIGYPLACWHLVPLPLCWNTLLLFCDYHGVFPQKYLSRQRSCGLDRSSAQSFVMRGLSLGKFESTQPQINAVDVSKQWQKAPPAP